VSVSFSSRAFFLINHIVPGTVLFSLVFPQYNIPFLLVAPSAARRVVCKTARRGSLCGAKPRQADLTRSGFAIRIINEERD